MCLLDTCHVQTAEDFTEMYESALGDNPIEPSAALAYDAVWTLALSLNRYVYICKSMYNITCVQVMAISIFCRSGVTNDSYTNTSALEDNLHQILSTNFTFTGVSVRS